MAFLKRAPTIVAWMAACGVAPCAFAQDLCSPLTAPTEPPPADDGEQPPSEDERVEITAGRVELGTADGAEFSEQVEFRYGDRTIAAERASYDRSEQRVEVSGRVTYRDPNFSVFGEGAAVDTATEEIRFSAAGFDLPQRPARGSAQNITLRSDRTISLSDVHFTTCPLQQTDWELIASQIHLDADGGIGTGRGVKLEFKGVPILYAPLMTFPIDDQRKSGFLTPHLADRDRTGLDIGVPYYLNLAPNYDMTLLPRYMSKRGVQVNTEFRYLLPGSDGQVNFEYLPDDDAAGNLTRRYVNLQHETLFGDGWQIVSGVEEVSDPAYFEDLGSSLSVTSQTHLNRYLDIGYFAPYWSVVSRLQNYQTIDTLIAEEDQPYERIPQVLFDGYWSGDRVGFESTTELANFERDVGDTGWRLDSTQEVSLRFGRAGMFFTPALALRQTNYWLDRADATADETPSRTLPIASLDTGLRFERPAGRSASFIQTLEPRLLYVHVPFEDQTTLPVFDTIVPDFNMVQLFRKYQFLGPDRVTDTDQLSFGITTRLIDTATGVERLSATLGQTRYLSTQAVSLPGELPNDANASDYIAELSIGLRPSWNMDVGYQWNSVTGSTARAETRFEYRPQEDRLFGFGYRYREGLLEQGDLSLVWPAAARWRVIARYSYSFLEDKPLEQFLGWEFEACCWRLRLVGRNFISRRTGESDNSILFQLELKGLSQGGSSPEELLDRGILGYRPMAQAQ